MQEHPYLNQQKNDNKTILIVDDSKTVRQFLDKLLSEAGYLVDQANDGLAAWTRLQVQQFDLVISDQEMPNMSGLELCEQIKNSNNHKLTYFIMLTTHDHVSETVHGLSAGADDYVGKTTDPQEILARVKAGFRVRSLQEELKGAYGHLYDQERLVSVGQLAAGVAHEINNPIGFVISNLNTLRTYISELEKYNQSLALSLNALDNQESEGKIKYITEDAKDLINESLEGTDRVAKIVKAMRSFARIDTGSEKPININDTIENTITLMANAFSETCTVSTDYGDLPTVRDENQELNQVFMNLLLNAAQSIDNKGEIYVRTWQEGGYAYVSIADTGCGIPPERLRQIFDPFFTTKPIGKGTGLGLSISREIMEKRGGHIRVASEPGAGSTFTMRLPLAKE